MYVWFLLQYVHFYSSYRAAILESGRHFEILIGRVAYLFKWSILITHANGHVSGSLYQNLEECYPRAD